MRTLLLILLSLSLNAQCETNRVGQSYLAIPGFFNLYFSGQCIEQNMSDTTICIKVPQLAQTQIAAFSYSSPNGAPAFINEIRQYDANCELFEIGSMIDSGVDTITVCYDIRTDLIDNFCPYMILSGGLSVEWCGIYAYYDEYIHVRFTTCSNAGTHKYDVIWSKDAVNWVNIIEVAPYQETSSKDSDYNLKTNYFQAGDNYYAIRETDLNGTVNVSDIVYVNVPYIATPKGGNYDILGREVGSDKFMYYVKPQK